MTTFRDIFRQVVVGQELGTAPEAFARQDTIYDVGDALGWRLQFANGWLMEIALEFEELPGDPQTAIASANEATVRLWDAKDDRVYWGPPDQDGNPNGELRSQSPDSVLSLIRMVAKEGRVA